MKKANETRKTRIVATLGPASQTKPVIKELILRGVNVFRLNLSHGTREYHRELIALVRKASKEACMPVAILADLQGPKIRTTDLKDGPVELKKAALFTFTSRKVLGNQSEVGLTYKRLPQDVKIGDDLFVNDGLLKFRVLKKTETDIQCRVLIGGLLSSRKGINVPGRFLNTSALSHKDLEDVRFFLKLNVDYFALSFVRKTSEVERLRKLLKKLKADTPIISKIETAQSIENIDSILEASDGIMVARGDLGIELPPEDVPIIQKMLIEKATQKRKLVITATQMLESMIHNKRPTRAETSDVANAIMDGTDAIMLSGETAIGKNPLEVVDMAAKIAKRAESSPYLRDILVTVQYSKFDVSLATAIAGVAAVEQAQAKAILVFTMSGATALLVSKLKPMVPLIAVTPSQSTLQRLCLIQGVRPVLGGAFNKSSDEMLKTGLKNALKVHLKKGERIVVLVGDIPGRGSTNSMKIIRAQ